MRPESRQDKLERLAARVTAGEVVFFIGAGFSLESERNSTQVLIARLLARVEALCEAFAGLTSYPGFPEAARDIRKGLRTTFWLKEAKSAAADAFGTLFDTAEPAAQDATTKAPGAQARAKTPSNLKSNLETLARNYYLINDWTCTSFEKLISLLTRPGVTVSAGLAGDVNRRENELLAKFHSIDPFKNTRPLAPIDFPWLIGLHGDSTGANASQGPVAGKALFLETLGFRDCEIMAGAPMDPSFQEAVKSASARLGPRHHVLAWLAAEGLCPTLVTTNYDFLLESAYRTAGLLPSNAPEARWGSNLPTPIKAAMTARLPVNSRYPCYTRVASAIDFFAPSKALQSALIHKMHGCADSYRIARERVPADYAMVRAVLPTIVFTFREIQNRRDDAWSRDYLSTLLRTRTVVFAGYSGADPVVHDTFRTVYEEMARQTARVSDAIHGAPAGKVKGARARAFFLDQETQREFYALEILRAAGLAERDLSFAKTPSGRQVVDFRRAAARPHTFRP